MDSQASRVRSALQKRVNISRSITGYTCLAPGPAIRLRRILTAAPIGSRRRWRHSDTQPGDEAAGGGGGVTTAPPSEGAATENKPTPEFNWP